MMTGSDVSAQPEAPSIASAPASALFAIGDPGRAAFATPDGPPALAISPPDVAASSAAVPGIRIRAASVRGIQHKAQHGVRQDAFALGQLSGGDGAVAVVCDGVGSLDRSDYAAALVSQRLTQLAMAGAPWPAAFETVNAELGEVATEWESQQWGAMATTAMALAVSRRSGWWIGEAAWVGDSPLWHLGQDGTWTPVTEVPAGDGQGYHSSAVRAMPTADGDCSWCSFRIYGGALFAMSDGVGNPLAWSAEVRDTLASWWACPPEPLTFAAQVGFARKSHVDDRTAVGIWPDGG
ncbi:MAG TPA: protein phosphatase 2C domain-containing protein [Streptosporangiaceae bacterium]|nr:protein phosphatase 2C domain-containing protein [Streptosporangiaceae bacterium]